MKSMLCLSLVIMSPFALAADLAAIAGHYTYTDYAVNLPNGKVLHLADLGAVSATLDIDGSDVITLRMIMRSGQILTQSAKILEGRFVNGTGYWVAQWPDMTYPVKAELTVRGDTLTSVTKFDNSSDVQRFGFVENSTLTKEHAP